MIKKFLYHSIALSYCFISFLCWTWPLELASDTDSGFYDAYFQGLAGLELGSVFCFTWFLIGTYKILPSILKNPVANQKFSVMLKACILIPLFPLWSFNK